MAVLKGIRSQDLYDLDALVEVVAILRDPERGCPWDIEQDFKSIIPSTLEECYELIDAIEREDFVHLEEELGDLLFQVIFYSEMANEKSLFNLTSVIDKLVDKLIRRHPHVFGEDVMSRIGEERSPKKMSSDGVRDLWEKLKADERRARLCDSAMDDIPLALPSLSRAQKVQKRASREGLDWDSYGGPLSKIEEELNELRAELAEGRHLQIESELGDLLFSCVNLARHLDIDAEKVLRNSTQKFERRFRNLEAEVASSGERLTELSEEQVDMIWETLKLDEP